MKSNATINLDMLEDLERSLIEAGEPISRIGLCLRVYLRLVSRLQLNGIMSAHTASTLIQENGLNKQNLSRALARLEAADFVKRGKGKPQSIYLNPRYITRCRTREYAKLLNNWRLMG